MGMLLCEQNFRDVWSRNESVRGYREVPATQNSCPELPTSHNINSSDAPGIEDRVSQSNKWGGGVLPRTLMWGALQHIMVLQSTVARGSFEAPSVGVP